VEPWSGVEGEPLQPEKVPFKTLKKKTINKKKGE